MRTLGAVSVADEIWVATALLHREHPDRPDFTLSEIVERAQREGVAPEHRPGLRPHASRHCVANVPRSPASHRLLFETGKSRRRLFKPGDAFHPDRRAGRTHPAKQDLPERYHALVDWYLTQWDDGTETDPLLALRGSWKTMLDGQSADDYVRELREGWE